MLLNAYRPCRHFDTCPEAVWNPKCGHIPRGFLGAAAQLSGVEVVMVFAEPGRPHEEESYDPSDSPAGLLNRGLRQTYDCYRNGADLFHRNVRWFLSNWRPLRCSEPRTLRSFASRLMFSLPQANPLFSRISAPVRSQNRDFHPNPDSAGKHDEKG